MLLEDDATLKEYGFDLRGDKLQCRQTTNYFPPNKIAQHQKISPRNLQNPNTKHLHKMYNLNTISSFHVTDPADTYIYEIIQVAGGLASISSDDSLRLLDPLALNGGPVNSIRRVNTDVTCLKRKSVV